MVKLMGSKMDAMGLGSCIFNTIKAFNFLGVLDSFSSALGPEMF
jgi:hypothetical protein